MSYPNSNYGDEYLSEFNNIKSFNEPFDSENSIDIDFASKPITNNLNNCNSQFKKSRKMEHTVEIERLNIQQNHERTYHVLPIDSNKSLINSLNLNIDHDINQNNKEKNNKVFIGKKRGKNISKDNPKFIAENPIAKDIFTIGDFDNYSKKIINEVNNNLIKKDYKIKDTRRKYRKDEILIKFMPKLFKEIKNKINKKLKRCKSKKYFKNLPKKYIEEYISMIVNSKKHGSLATIDYTLETIFTTKFNETRNNKLQKNINTIEYLKEENNKYIYENSNFNVYKDLKFSEILKNYFGSKEFGMHISELKDQHQEEDYIKEYILQVKKILNLFSYKMDE